MDTLDPGRTVLARNATAAGARGAVACTARSAAAAGAAALERGGNAVDAALAAALVETVAMPPKCGLGGELVALVLTPGAAPRSLLALGQAPGALLSHVADHGLPLTGPASVAVPAAPAGYAALADLGRLGLAAAAAPAISLAGRGIAWSPLCARLAAQADELLRRWQPDGCVYRPVAAPHRIGDVVPLPGLADLLREFVVLGAELFHGDVGQALVGRVRALGGVLDADDLRAARAEWTEPVRWTANGSTVHATPAPTYGAALLDALAAVEAGAGVAGAVADASALRPGDPAVDAVVAAGGTSAVAAVDSDGTAVVVVHSNSFPQFGSGVVVPEYDLVLSNRAGRGFSADPGAPNALRAGARPATTLHAWMLEAPQRPAVLGATSGGEHQIEWNAQLLARLLADPQADLGEAVLADRWERVGGVLRTEDWSVAGAAPVTSSHALVRLGDGRQAPVAVADPRLGGTAVGV